MRYTQENAVLLYKLALTDTAWSFTLKAPVVAGAAQPGQFVQVLCDGFTLRRPISIGGIDAENGILRLVFEVRGKGTTWLSGLAEGDTMDIIGPLGHGFPLLEKGTKAVLVGGGIGTPPLLPLAQYYGADATAITGFRNAGAVILQQDLQAYGAETILCTDDGSAGFAGFTPQALAEHLEQHSCGVIYTCGPKVMMKLVAQTAAAHGVLCYVSMEERMACGVGACLGCTCKTKGENGQTKMTRVCTNGPVFDAKEVDFT